MLSPGALLAKRILDLLKIQSDTDNTVESVYFAVATGIQRSIGRNVPSIEEYISALEMLVDQGLISFDKSGPFDGWAAEVTIETQDN